MSTISVSNITGVNAITVNTHTVTSNVMIVGTAVTVLANGNIGFGNTAPAVPLHSTAPSTTAYSLTWGATTGQILRNENSEFAFGLHNASPYPLYIQGRTLSSTARDIILNPAGGNIGIGNATAPIATLQVGGTFAATGVPTQMVYVRADGKTTYSVATAGQTGTYISDLNATITPRSSGSKILVNYCLCFECVHDTIFKLFRSIGGTDTEIGTNVNDANYWSGIWYPGYDADNSSTPRTNQMSYLDSPNTTSAITYKLMIQSAGTGAFTYYQNRPIGSAGQASYEVGISQVFLQEISV